MATLWKTSSTGMAACNTASDGSGTNVLASTGDDVIIGALASGTTTYTNPAGGSSFRSWSLTSDYTPATLTTTTNGAATRTSVTVADNKTLNIQPYLEANTSVTTTLTMALNGSAAVLNANINSTVAGTGTIIVSGGGTLRTGDSAQGSTTTYEGASYIIRDGSTVIVGNGSGNNTLGRTSLTFDSGGGTLRFDASRIINYTGSITINSAATISSPASVTASTNAAVTGGAVLTIGGTAGFCTFAMTGTSKSISCPLVITGFGGLSLTTSTSNVASATISGAGSISFSGGTLGPVNATGYTGVVSGSVVVTGARSATNNVFSNRFAGNTALAASASATFSGTNTSGYLTTIPSGASVLVTGTFTGTTSPVLLTGTLELSNVASIANSITFTGGTLNLSAGATCTVNSTSGADTTVPTFAVTDATACTYSGNLTASTATGGSINYRVAANGKMTLSGAHSTATAKPFALNSLAANTGIIVVSGAGLSGATATLSYGKLSITGTGSKTVGTTLTAAGGTTVAYSATQSTLNSALVFQANSTLQFGTSL